MLEELNLVRYLGSCPRFNHLSPAQTLALTIYSYVL